MYDHNVPRCTTEHLHRVRHEIGSTSTDPVVIEMKSKIDAELKRRKKQGEATVKTLSR